MLLYLAVAVVLCYCIAILLFDYITIAGSCQNSFFQKRRLMVPHYDGKDKGGLDGLGTYSKLVLMFIPCVNISQHKLAPWFPTSAVVSSWE